MWRGFMHNVSQINSDAPVKSARAIVDSMPLIDVIPRYVNPASRPMSQIDLQPDDMSNINKRSAQRLRKGKETPQATLDLHGFTQAEAIHKFHQFLTETSHAGLRVLRIITGYGKMSGGNGVLRAALPRWINLPENRRLVLSYHQARPQEGGAGAWILLLKRKERL